MTAALRVARAGGAGAQSAASMGGAPTPSPSSVYLAGEHFAAAMLYLVAGAIGLVWIAPELAIGAFASPHVVGVTHLFTLGWLTTTIFGALYQLIPVALGAPLRSVRAGHASFWTFVPGVALFASGIAANVTVMHHLGITLVAIGILLAVGNVASSLPRARSRDVTWAAVAIALCFLSATLVLGVVLLHNLHTGFIAEARMRVLAVHIHVALVGWALIMITGVSHRLLPMFLLSHGANTRWTKRALALLGSGVLALCIGLDARMPAIAWTAVALLEAGVGCFIWQAYSFYRARVRRKIDVGMRFAGSALGFLALSALIGAAVLARGLAHPRLVTIYVIVGLLGGIVLYVIGFFYKIVPLLAWTVRYRNRLGKGTAPTVAATFSSNVAHVQLACMALGVVALACGTAAASGQVVRGGAVIFLAGVLLFVSQIVRVAVGKSS
ncbi:MAG TPA: hypothetical protein VLI43_13005 [Gemmatimonadaceae bacterium]|nr:hypothetical protein [Gemmatimonadaceae bacterium]